MALFFTATQSKLSSDMNMKVVFIYCYYYLSCTFGPNKYNECKGHFSGNSLLPEVVIFQCQRPEKNGGQ